MKTNHSESLWDTSPPDQTWPPLDQELETDVVVIGGGITGLTAALKLAEAGKHVVLIEGKRIGSGTTGGSSAHLTEQIDCYYSSIITDFGIDEAKLVAAASRNAIDHIERRTEALGIACGFERVPGWLVAESEEDLEELEQEHAAAHEAGVDVVMEQAVPLPYPVSAGLRFRHQAKFDSLAYVRGLAAEAHRKGVRIHEHTQVVKVDDGEPCVVHLESGATVKAQAVFCATHSSPNWLFLNTKLAPYRSYIAAFADVPLPNALFWDMAEPYHYLRCATIGGQRYVLVGGEDHKTGGDEEAHHIDALVDWARGRLRAGKPSFTWSAQLYESVDGLPYIGRNSASKHVYVCTGLSGHGLTLGTAGALMVSDLILGIANPFERVFTATRIKPIASLLPFVKENASFPAHLIGDRLTAPPLESVADLPRGEGRVLRAEGRRVAVYRDEENGLHAVSAVCTHMGCLVKFNDLERTWDCPCHGSRFDVGGEVLDGPATRALQKLEIADALPPLRKTGSGDE